MATLNPRTADGLNTLLAEERASVECEIAFASGAGEYLEREAFATMGREDVEVCVALHEQLAAVEAPVTSQVSPAGQGILALERYDERLRAFAQHQQSVSARSGELLRDVGDDDVRPILQRLSELHVWHALWAEQHADEFAATRSWENGRRPREGQGRDALAGLAGTGGADGTDPAQRAALPTMREEPPGPDGAGRAWSGRIQQSDTQDDPMDGSDGA